MYIEVRYAGFASLQGRNLLEQHSTTWTQEYDSMDGIGSVESEQRPRATQDAKIEEQLSRSKKRLKQNPLF